MEPYGIVSDQHFHNWSAFASVNAAGINSRLEYQLNELRRCADAVRAAGGNTIFNAGDTFHVRGSLAPSVLNPVIDLHRELIAEGFKIHILAGNHDLESRESNRISSAITALSGVGCSTASDGMTTMLPTVKMLPWIQSVEELKRILEEDSKKPESAGCDLIIHAPIDGVIPGLPDHGLTGEYLETLSYRRIFSGHYHNHKEIAAGRVWSIGATTHQTWGDVGTKAGFLVVTDSEVKWHSSHAPSFIDIDASTPVDDIPLIVDGNFVRIRTESTKSSDIEALRAHMLDCGARGVNIIQVKSSAASVSRTGGAVMKSGETTEASVNTFINSQSFKSKPALSTLCADIMATVRSAA